MPLRRLGPCVLLTGALLVACSAPSPTPATPTPAGSPSPPGAVATDGSATATPRASGSTAPTTTPIAAEPPALGLEPVASGLADPISISPMPDGRLLVNERGGRVVMVDPAAGTTAMALDITDRVRGEGEQGLLGLVLHPEWPDDPRAFVHYSDRDGNTVLATFTTTDPDAPSLDPAGERVLLRVSQPYANHNGGQLAFGPDGMLYLGLGDGGAGGDPQGNGQDPSTLLGAILRLDVDGGDPYAIPADNPFADGDGGAPEVYLYGLRNPWRFSFDRATDDLWIADVGQGAWEEVSRLRIPADAGANLGWNVLEGTHCFAQTGCDPAGLVLPVTEYGHDLGCSVTGGHVYRGARIEGLAGWYLFSDYCSGTLFGVPSDAEATGMAPRVLLETDASVAAFGEAADGELYLADLRSGAIYRIVGG
ncbi:MAG TPA: PQQ-dependent sugar dehydrogenase [Candidatus Limnocylindria bacterium]|nr:PQQ-dependent sugar dehydrogenase [Candidatus Limnocylindria bacterium]